MKRENMCIIDDEFFITTAGKIYFKGNVYDVEACEFKEGSKLVIHYGEKKVEKLLKKDIHKAGLMKLFWMCKNW